MKDGRNLVAQMGVGVSEHVQKQVWEQYLPEGYIAMEELDGRQSLLLEKANVKRRDLLLNP